MDKKVYDITFGNGTLQSTTKRIEVESFENEQTAVDKMIDAMEECGEDSYFLDESQTFENGGDIYDDEYIIGGNHGRILFHGGFFMISEVNN